LFSVGANAKHGLKRSPEDKRRAVQKLLADEEWVARSDRWIAEVCKVSHTFVADLRRETTGNVASSTPRAGADGKVRRVPERKPPAPPTPPEPEEDFDDLEEEEDGATSNLGKAEARDRRPNTALVATAGCVASPS
jgi:hypothetical protein